MVNRKTYGNIIFGTAFVLAILMLAGVIAWKHDWSNTFLGVAVFVLYGMGQWLSVLYWHNIQKDWEDTGVVLAKLQQAVTNIPEALDSNLKSIATRLTEGQAQALEKLQGQVNDGARETLEKGALQIGDSLAKNLAAPLAAMKTLLEGFSKQTDAQGSRLEKLTETVGEESRKSVAQGAELVAGSLDRNLKAPLTALEGKLQAWSKSAETQTESARGLGEEIRRAQREGSDQAQRLAEQLSQELKSLAGSQAEQAQALLAAWGERASAAQADSEARLQTLQSALLADVTGKLQLAQASQAASQERVLEKALSGVEAQAKAAQDSVAGQVKALQTAAAEQTKSLQTVAGEQTKSLQSAVAEQAKASQSAAADQARNLRESADAFAAGIASLKDTTLQLVQDVEAKASATLEAQSQLGLEVAGKVSDLADRMNQGSQNVAELAHTAQINQTEMQAGVAMLNSGLSSILDRLERQATAGDGYQSLLAELGKTLADFQERSAEVLVENALKTQEILMEVLRHQDGREQGERADESKLASVT